MRLNIYAKTETGPKPICLGLDLKGTVNDRGMMRLVNVNLQQKLSEYLGKHIVSTGMNQIWSCGPGFWSSYQKKAGAEKDILSNGFRETIIGGPSYKGEAEEGLKWSEHPVVTEDGETDFIVGVDVFDTGFVLRSSAKVTNIVGRQYDAYFEKITSKNFKQTSRNYAKIFKDEKAVLKYLTDKKDIFSEMYKKYGYQFEIEPASELYRELRGELSGKTFDSIDMLLQEIRECEPEEPKYELGENAHDEAWRRMKEMDIWTPVRRDFMNNDKLYMSEFGGAVYDLNDDAKKAVQLTSKYGLPYHVIRTESEIGDMYAVLYVSNYPEEWQMEHLDPRTGVIVANVYNASMGIDEIGSIKIEKANGGLMRVA